MLVVESSQSMVLWLKRDPNMFEVRHISPQLLCYLRRLPSDCVQKKNWQKIFKKGCYACCINFHTYGVTLGCSFLWGQLDTTNEKQTRGSSKAVRNVGRECWTYESSVYLLGVGRFLRSEVKYLRACCSLSLHYLYSSSLWTTLMLCWCYFCQTVLDLMIFALSNKSKRFTGSPVLESSF